MLRPLDTSHTLTLPFASDEGLRHRFQVVEGDIPANFRFGPLLEALDTVAGETALRYVRQFYPEGQVVTAAIDAITVRNAAELTQDVVLMARINHVGRSSMDVGIRIEQRKDRQSVHIASCYITMVARSGGYDGAVSIELPPLAYLDELEVKRAAKAQARRESYRMQQQASLRPPSAEEYMMLSQLHRAQDEPGFAGLKPGRMVTESWERMYPELEKVPRSIFGGYLIRRAYELATICAEFIASYRAVIVAVNRINFLHRVLIDDKLHYTCRVIYSGKSSICIEADIERISRDRSSKALSNKCLFTFVSVDKQMQPVAVPTVYPTTYDEDDRYLLAYRQHQEHLATKKARTEGAEGHLASL